MYAIAPLSPGWFPSVGVPTRRRLELVEVTRGSVWRAEDIGRLTVGPLFSGVVRGGKRCRVDRALDTQSRFLPLQLRVPKNWNHIGHRVSPPSVLFRVFDCGV